MTRLALLAATTFVLAMPAAALAAPVAYTATLAGANENPVNASPGSGSTTVFYDAAAHTLRVVVSFSGLTAGTSASHIHCCTAPPGNAGVATTTPTFPGFPLGVTAGTYDNTLDLTSAEQLESGVHHRAGWNAGRSRGRARRRARGRNRVPQRAHDGISRRRVARLSRRAGSRPGGVVGDSDAHRGRADRVDRRRRADRLRRRATAAQLASANLAPVETAVRDRFADVRRAHAVAAIDIGDRARDFEDAMVGAGR